MAGSPRSGGMCELELVLRGDRLELSSDGCRDYCGVRVSLDSTFALATRQVKASGRAETTR